MSNIIFWVLLTIVFMVFSGIAIVAIPFIREKTELIKDEKIRKWVSDAVDWAEQSIKGTGKGDERKSNVMMFLTALAYEKNWQLTAEQIEILVEAAVKAMNGK